MKRTKLLLLTLLVGFGLMSFIDRFHDVQFVKEKNGYEIGDEATDFALKNVDGKKVSLQDYSSAKGFIVVFTCNTCPYAVKYEDRINALDQEFKDKGYPVIAINPNDPTAQPDDEFSLMVKKAKDKGFTFPYLVDEGQQIYKQYGATRTPHVFVLKKEGAKYIVKYIGAIDDNYDDPLDVTDFYVESAVNQLLSGDQVLVPKTVAVGCTIKVKK